MKKLFKQPVIIAVLLLSVFAVFSMFSAWETIDNMQVANTENSLLVTNCKQSTNVDSSFGYIFSEEVILGSYGQIKIDLTDEGFINILDPVIVGESVRLTLTKGYYIIVESEVKVILNGKEIMKNAEGVYTFIAADINEIEVIGMKMADLEVTRSLGLAILIGITLLIVALMLSANPNVSKKNEIVKKIKIFKLIFCAIVVVIIACILLFANNIHELLWGLCISFNASALIIATQTIVVSVTASKKSSGSKSKLECTKVKNNVFQSGELKEHHEDMERLTCFQNVIDNFYKTEKDYVNALDKLEKDNAEFLRNVKIPEEYKEFAKKYDSKKLYSEREENYFYYGEGEYEYYEFFDVEPYDELIEKNDYLLTMNEVWMQFYKLLIFASDESGHCFFALNYKLSDTDPSVIYFDEETFECSEVAPTLKDFIAGLSKGKEE